MARTDAGCLRQCIASGDKTDAIHCTFLTWEASINGFPPLALFRVGRAKIPGAIYEAVIQQYSVDLQPKLTHLKG